MRSRFRVLGYWLLVSVCLTFAISAPAQTEHRWLFGVVGSQSVLDTYLSPLSYTGISHGTFHRSERPAHFGEGRWSVLFQTATNFSYTDSPTDDGHFFDGQGTIGAGLARVWNPAAPIPREMATILRRGAWLRNLRPQHRASTASPLGACP